MHSPEDLVMRAAGRRRDVHQPPRLHVPHRANRRLRGGERLAKQRGCRRSAGGDQERLTKITADLQKLATQHPSDAGVWFELAASEWDKDDDQRDLAAARAAVDKALALKADHVRANVLLGRLLAKEVDAKGDYSDAAWRAVRKPIALANRTNPDDPLTTGIEVAVRPVGKKIERLSLLSGGERSLAAVALLTAIFKARPSPFYILDEVEAALDDANLGRLLGVFEQLRESSQLIVITHQKRTMEIADALYGVSMRQDGVSAVVGQRLGDRAAS